jgi:hypothetical protein
MSWHWAGVHCCTPLEMSSAAAPALSALPMEAENLAQFGHNQEQVDQLMQICAEQKRKLAVLEHEHSELIAKDAISKKDSRSDDLDTLEELWRLTSETTALHVYKVNPVSSLLDLVRKMLLRWPGDDEISTASAGSRWQAAPAPA